METYYKVNEFFSSIQGEGIEVGKPVFFLRLAGCNRACLFCDTHYKKVNFTLSIWEILELVRDSGNSSVVITGGEPLLQSLDSLVALLYQKGIAVSIESNGDKEIPLSYVNFLSVIAQAPKSKKTLLHLTKRKKYFIRAKSIIKILYPFFSGEEIEEFLSLMTLNNSKTIIYLMPVNGEKDINLRNTKEALSLVSEFSEKYPILDIRFGTQLHKFIGVE